jgi:hypothetical protein
VACTLSCVHSGQEDEITHQTYHDVIGVCATLAAMRMTFTLFRVSGQFVSLVISASVEHYHLLTSDAVLAGRTLPHSSAIRALLACLPYSSGPKKVTVEPRFRSFDVNTSYNQIVNKNVL